MPTWIIYKIFCPISQKSYIGLTTDSLSQRWSNHVCQATRTLSKMLLHKAIRKYGREAFSAVEISRHDTLEDASQTEREAIGAHRTLAPAGYNLADGGMGTPGVRRPHSEETKKKIGAAHKGRVFAPSTLAIWSANRTGRKHTAEARANMHDAFVKTWADPAIRARRIASIRAAFKARKEKQDQKALPSEKPTEPAHPVPHTP